MSEYDWDAHPLRHDPITGQDICYSCWFSAHLCGIKQCKCLCKDLEPNALEVRRKERSVRRAQRKDKKQALPDSPLKAENSEPDRRLGLEKFIAERYHLDLREVRKLNLIRLAGMDSETRKNLLLQAVKHARRIAHGS